MSADDAIRQQGISEFTFYPWRKEYAWMTGNQLRHLRVPEKQSEPLRWTVANLALDK